MTEEEREGRGREGDEERVWRESNEGGEGGRGERERERETQASVILLLMCRLVPVTLCVALVFTSTWPCDLYTNC